MVIVANKLVYFLALCLGDFLLKFFKRTLPELLMRLSLHHHPVQFDSRHLQRLFRGVHLHHLCSLQTLHHIDRTLAFPDLLDIQRSVDQFF